jgi:PEP-CTERM motif
MERKIVTSPQTKGLTAVIALTLGGALLAPSANAVVILPGQSLAPNGSGAFSGTKIDDVTTPFVGKDILNNIVFTGSLESQVYRESGGTLDFVYQFSNDNNPNNDSIERFTVDDYTGFSTVADDIPATGVFAPNLVTRQPAGTGDVIGFQFAGVAPGANTDILTIQTNATAFQIGSAALQDGGNVSIPAPVPAVPEPATIGLLALSLSGLTLRRRRA